MKKIALFLSAFLLSLHAISIIATVESDAHNSLTSLSTNNKTEKKPQSNHQQTALIELPQQQLALIPLTSPRNPDTASEKSDKTVQAQVSTQVLEHTQVKHSSERDAAISSFSHLLEKFQVNIQALERMQVNNTYNEKDVAISVVCQLLVTTGIWIASYSTVQRLNSGSELKKIASTAFLFVASASIGHHLARFVSSYK
jgi:hypothetical protein